jgi:nucleotide-binding universal stress UspA family protein
MEGFPAKILLATDGSEDAALAARTAAGLSERACSELHIVHVLPRFPRYAYPGVTPQIYSRVRDEELRGARDLLEEQVKGIQARGARVAESHTRRGSTVDEILDLAEELRADLIVVGSRGLGPVRGLLLGSVSGGIVHGATSPVLVLRGGENAWPPNRIVVGDDGSEEAKGAGVLAARIGKLLDAGVLLVRAYPWLPETDAEGREFDARRVDDELRREERTLESRAKEIEDASGALRPRVGITVGEPATAMLEAAGEDEERTLLAVGSRGLDATRRLRLGSVSTKVLHAAHGPVLIYPHLAVEKVSRDSGSLHP